MMAASTNINFQTKLTGFAFAFTANDFSDLEKSEVEKRIDRVWMIIYIDIIWRNKYKFDIFFNFNFIFY